MYNWVNQLRNEEIGVRTHEIIDKAISIEPAFKDGTEGKRRVWVYHFLRRHDLIVHVRARFSQITDSLIQSAKRGYCRRVMRMYNMQVANPKFLCNINQTPVYMNCASTGTVHRRGEHTVSIRTGRSSPNLVTVAVTFAMDGAKLPLFYIFKRKKGGRIQRTLNAITPTGIVCAVQERAWMDADVMRLWMEKVWRPYVSECNGKYMLLLDDYACHKTSELEDSLKQINTIRVMIPPHYTSVMQTFDVEFNKPLKHPLKHRVGQWRREKHRTITLGDKLPSAKRAHLLECLPEIWERFQCEIMKNALKVVDTFLRKELITVVKRNLNLTFSNQCSKLVCRI